MNIGQFALIKKDIRGITSNKQIFAVLLIVPLVQLLSCRPFLCLKYHLLPMLPQIFRNYWICCLFPMGSTVSNSKLLV